MFNSWTEVLHHMYDKGIFVKPTHPKILLGNVIVWNILLVLTLLFILAALFLPQGFDFFIGDFYEWQGLSLMWAIYFLLGFFVSFIK